MKIVHPLFRVDDDCHSGVDGVDEASQTRFRPVRGLATPSHTQGLGTLLGVLAGIWADYEAATDLKRRVQSFIIGPPLAIRGSEI